MFRANNQQFMDNNGSFSQTIELNEPVSICVCVCNAIHRAPPVTYKKNATIYLYERKSLTACARSENCSWVAEQEFDKMHFNAFSWQINYRNYLKYNLIVPLNMVRARYNLMSAKLRRSSE